MKDCKLSNSVTRTYVLTTPGTQSQGGAFVRPG
jgi:hypothetical protein